jgi:hypothetical protein
MSRWITKFAIYWYIFITKAIGWAATTSNDHISEVLESLGYQIRTSVHVIPRRPSVMVFFPVHFQDSYNACLFIS